MVDYAVKEERLYIDAWHPGRRGDREKYVDGIVNLVGSMPRKLILNSNSQLVSSDPSLGPELCCKIILCNILGISCL